MFSNDVEFSSHAMMVNNVMVGNLTSTSHQAKVETAGLKLWKMHLVWTSGIWSKVIEHLDMWAWNCTGAVWSLMLQPDGNSFIFMSAMSEYCECADGFFPYPFWKAKQLLMWFHSICYCTFKAETSSLNRMLAGVSTKLYTSVQNSRAICSCCRVCKLGGNCSIYW